MDERQHLLIKLSEECAEVQHVISKMLLFGDRTQYQNNEEQLQIEFNDILAVADMLFAKYYDLCRDEELIDAKIGKVQHFMDEARELGMLTDD